MKWIVTYLPIPCVFPWQIPQFNMKQYWQDTVIYFIFIALNVAMNYGPFESKLVLWEAPWDCVDLDSFPVKSANLFISINSCSHIQYIPWTCTLFIVWFYHGEEQGSSDSLSLPRPKGHIFHKAWDTMIIYNHSKLTDWFCLVLFTEILKILNLLP